VLLKITQEKFKNEVLTNKHLKTHGDIVLKNPYKQVPAPSPPRPLPKDTGTENMTLDEIINDSNPYEIFANVQHIGGGGFSQVYCAVMKENGKKVAIKKTKILQAIAVSENSGYTTEFKGHNERIKELEKSYNEAARLARALMRDEQSYASASLAMGEQLSAIGAPEKLKSIAGPALVQFAGVQTTLHGH